VRSQVVDFVTGLEITEIRATMRNMRYAFRVMQIDTIVALRHE